MTIRLVRRTAAGLAFVAVLVVVAAPSGAQSTGISGQVDSVLSLSLRRIATDRVEARATATVGGTRLAVSQPADVSRALADYDAPMTRAQVTVRVDVSATGVTERTITLGPQTP